METTTQSANVKKLNEIKNLSTAHTWSLNETPENWEIYRPPNENDEAFIQLRQSIAENGFLNEHAITISSDRFIISGHRRFRAALAERLHMRWTRFLDQ